MSVIAETGPAALAGTSRAFGRNRDLVLDEISEVFQRVDPAQVAALVTELRLADRIFVTGAGRSGLVLKMAAMRLMHLGLTVHVVGETTAPAIRAGDLLLAASGSGTTAGVVKAARDRRRPGCPGCCLHHQPRFPARGSCCRRRTYSGRPKDGPRLGPVPAVLGQPLRAGAVCHHRSGLPKPVGRGCGGRGGPLAAPREPRISPTRPT